MSPLILIRHGQSIWNLQNRFTGWIDVSLSHQVVDEVQRAAALAVIMHNRTAQPAVGSSS